MCGDHPSYTKTDLNEKEVSKMDEKDSEKERKTITYSRLTPSPSRTVTSAKRTASRRRVRSLDAVRDPQCDLDGQPNRQLVQAALNSFRWPPYLLAVWVLVLLLTHALHCLLGLLERALPAMLKCGQYLRHWTEDSWRAERDNRLRPAGLAALTGFTYMLYFALYALYCITLWAMEPLCGDVDEKQSEIQDLASYKDDEKNSNA